MNEKAEMPGSEKMKMIDKIAEEQHKFEEQGRTAATHITMHIDDRLTLDAECYHMIKKDFAYEEGTKPKPDTIRGLEIEVDYSGKTVKQGEFILFLKVESEKLQWTNENLPEDDKCKLCKEETEKRMFRVAAEAARAMLNGKESGLSRAFDRAAEGTYQFSDVPLDLAKLQRALEKEQ